MERRRNPPETTATEADAGLLRQEIVRLQKIIDALINRAEQSAELQGSEFSLFQTAALLEEQVSMRTEALQRALRENERIRRDLSKSEAKFAAMFSLTPDPMVLTRLSDGAILDVSHSGPAFFGYRTDEVLGRTTRSGPLNIWANPADRQQWLETIMRMGEVHGFETTMVRKDGSQVTVLVSGKRIEIDGEPCVLAIAHDITERKRYTEHIEQVAQHDPLTGLPNRLLLADRLQQAITQSRRDGTRVAVCYLDLDGFKAVNDKLGHQTGDQVLIEVATRLTRTLRGGDTVSRLGGDEFVILLSGLNSEEECRQALDRLMASCAAPFNIEGGGQSGISASIGVTIFPGDTADADTLIRHADHAMYAAKQAGKNRYQLFDMRLEQRIEARNATLRQIEIALTAGQFELYFQPKVDCRLGQLVGAEALIRWNHPTLGVLSPAEFVPLMEESELAHQAGHWVLREALAQIADFRRHGFDIVVSVNAFIRHLTHADFVPRLQALLSTYPEVPPHCLRIEIVETAAINEIDTLRRVIEECTSLGIEFSLDDFGTGYSTLAHLRHLPATEIKIDQSFVGHMLTRAEDIAIVEAVIGLGRAFGNSVTAEGAETSEHIRRLLQLGCSVMQGYAIARPMSAPDFRRWVTDFRSERFLRSPDSDQTPNTPPAAE